MGFSYYLNVHAENHGIIWVMQGLNDHLKRLDDFLQDQLKYQGHLFVNYEDISTIGNTSRVPKDKVQTESEFFQTFNLLVTKGFSWINFNGAAVIDGKLLVVIELPRESVGVPSEGVSINLSGPNLNAKTNFVLA